MDDDDGELIEQVLSGVSVAFERLLERHERVLWASIRRRVPDEHLARELFQEAAVRAFERLGQLRSPDQLRSWWLSIAMNLVRDRGRGTRPAPLEEVAEPIDEQQPDPAGELEAEEERARTERAIADLPERQREVCRLRWGEGLAHSEIAELLGITAEASRANAYQALRRLRASLDGEPDGAPAS